MAAAEPISREYATHVFPTIGEKLYMNKDFADFHFVFNSGERIPVHKMLLATASDVFRVMFNGSWIEKTEVEIVDSSADAFKEFLQFIYLPNSKVTIGNVSEVMNLGKKYDIAECFDICGEFLTQNIGVDDVLWIYEVAKHLSHEELEGKCVKYVEQNTASIFASESFLNFDQETVKWILQMDSLCCTEVGVFEALMKWMKAKSGRDELTADIVQGEYGDLMHEIRFGSMTLAEFIYIDSLYGALFTLDENREIMRMINSPQYQPTIFKKNGRNNFWLLQWDTNAVIECSRWIKYGEVPYYIKDIETTTFTINKLVLLGAFTCTWVSFYENSYEQFDKDLPSEITIIESFNFVNPKGSIVLYSGTVNLSSRKLTEVVLRKPILIRPGRQYQIQMKQSPPNKCCTKGSLKSKVQIDPDITIQFHNDPIVENEARGLIIDLSLYKIK